MKAACKYCGDEHECTRLSPRERALKRWGKLRPPKIIKVICHYCNSEPCKCTKGNLGL